ncbi:FCD domain-containing protein [Leifsonia sp. Root4]|uniref:FCD domain-containing protein n=1 Tax=Leifsonia sp. Root4 TaxID=1736525 RepID=UPI003369E9EE
MSGQAGRTHAPEAAEEHRAMYDAIRSGDETAAAELMRSHIETAGQRTLARRRAEKPRCRPTTPRSGAGRQRGWCSGGTLVTVVKPFVASAVVRSRAGFCPVVALSAREAGAAASRRSSRGLR